MRHLCHSFLLIVVLACLVFLSSSCGGAQPTGTANAAQPTPATSNPGNEASPQLVEVNKRYFIWASITGKDYTFDCSVTEHGAGWIKCDGSRWINDNDRQKTQLTKFTNLWLNADYVVAVLPYQGAQ